MSLGSVVNVVAAQFVSYHDLTVGKRLDTLAADVIECLHAAKVLHRPVQEIHEMGVDGQRRTDVESVSRRILYYLDEVQSAFQPIHAVLDTLDHTL